MYGIRNVINMPVTFQRDDYIAAKKLFGYNVKISSVLKAAGAACPN